MDHHEAREFGLADGVGGGGRVADAPGAVVIEGGLEVHDAPPGQIEGAHGRSR